ncbi:hypothetical protein M3231_08855 [Neobacillus mesonae]|nr:hypothetical protein [Neobacillus mesonae]
MAANTSYEEHTLIKSYLQLLIVIRIFNRDLRILGKYDGLKTPELYTEMIRSGIERVSVLLDEVGKEFKRLGIHIKSTNFHGGEITADAYIRGETVQIHIPDTTYKDELYKRMQIYLGGTP